MFQKIRNQLNKGFTLIELMIIIAIIGILSSVAIPAFLKYRDTARSDTIIESVQQKQETTVPEVKEEEKSNKEFKKI